jgi:hypothetical protein
MFLQHKTVPIFMGSGCGVMKRFSLMSNVYTKKSKSDYSVFFSSPLTLPRVTNLLRNMWKTWNGIGQEEGKGGKEKIGNR